jgi:hypothetical protein
MTRNPQRRCNRGQRLALGCAQTASATEVQGEIAEVRSAADLDAWHSVYYEVFGANPRSRIDWRRVHGALGPSGEGSLLRLLARVEGTTAATGAVFSSTGAWRVCTASQHVSRCGAETGLRAHACLSRGCASDRCRTGALARHPVGQTRLPERSAGGAGSRTSRSSARATDTARARPGWLIRRPDQPSG